MGLNAEQLIAIGLSLIGAAAIAVYAIEALRKKCPACRASVDRKATICHKCRNPL